MSNYILYPIVELKGFIIFSVIFLFFGTAMVLYFMGRAKAGMEAFRWQALFLGRTRREIIWMCLGISQIALVVSTICFFVPMGIVQITALALLCATKGFLGLSLGGFMGELLFGGLTGTALMAGNLLMDYMKETGVDVYILLIWAMLSLFVIQYGIYFFIKGLERMLQRHERAKKRQEQRKKHKAEE